jgi:hypothetical protein
MPSISDTSYSRDACIAAVRDYYRFLVKMYLDESQVMEPPEGGWPNITTKTLERCGKSHEVIAVLRQLPYIRHTGDDSPQVAAFCQFADWRGYADKLNTNVEPIDFTMEATEGYEYWKDVPSHVFGLAYGRSDDPIILVDTELGIVHWPNCPGPIRLSPKMIHQDPIEYAPENEEEWRCETAWAIPDFFEVLKDELRKLNSIPSNTHEVIDVYSNYLPDEVIAAIRNVYREHGWPDLERYRKEDCLKAIKAMMEDRFPRHA